jgi:hypothetical protein
MLRFFGVAVDTAGNFTIESVAVSSATKRVQK